MYAKCGSLEEAQQVFEKLPFRDTVSWNILIMGYTEQGDAKQALAFFGQMQLENGSPDTLTYIYSLKACSSMSAICIGSQIFSEVARIGLFEDDVHLGNNIVDMFIKCGMFDKAQEVFGELPVRDVISWTTLIAGYVEHGFGKEALHCFAQFKYEGLSPDPVMFACILKACGNIGDCVLGQEIHVDIIKRKLLTNELVGNALVNMYAGCGLLGKSREVFDELSVQDVVSWTALIAGYVEHGFNVEALKTFNEMRMEEVNPNLVTYICCLKACSNLQSLDEGWIIHADVVKEGIEVDLFIGNTLVDLYAKCGSFIEAQDVFDEQPFQDIVSLNALISGFAEQGFGKEALLVYMQMQEKGISPDIVTFASILKACGNKQALDIGKKVHSQICSSRCIDNTDMIISVALLDMYGKCGSMFESQLVFDELPRRELMHWTALITGYTRQGKSEYVSYFQ